MLYELKCSFWLLPGELMLMEEGRSRPLLGCPTVVQAEHSAGLDLVVVMLMNCLFGVRKMRGQFKTFVLSAVL